jgi:nitrate/nitrite transport system substrate-binding protein
MIRWGEAPDDVDANAIAKLAFRPDIYCEAVEPLGIACPSSDEKVEGAHPHTWLLSDATEPVAMGADQFMDQRIFDPTNIDSYISGFSIRDQRSRLGALDTSQITHLAK